MARRTWGISFCLLVVHPLLERSGVMAEDALIRPKLLVVKEIRDNAATIIIFEGGKTGKLSKGSKDYKYYLELAQRSLKRQWPVAVQMAEADTVTEIMSADNDIVAMFVERDKEKMLV